MVKPTPVEGLSDAERELLVEALRALRHQRGKAWNAALAVSKRQPSLRSAGIDDIQRLARRIDGRATHWSEE